MKSDAFRAAAEAKDFEAVPDLFSDDVVFLSPAVFQQYEGREALTFLLSNVVQVFEDFRYLDQIESGDAATLIFEARIGDRTLNGADVLWFDDEGRIKKMMVMVRPLSGLNALAEAMSARITAAQQA